jgi:hypothetical protein
MTTAEICTVLAPFALLWAVMLVGFTVVGLFGNK